MRWAAPVALCACNQVFGLHATKLADGPTQADAQFFDAPTDAPFMCPGLGTAPDFSPVLHQLGTQKCLGYTESPAASLASAICGGQVAEATLTARGDLGSAFSPSTLIGGPPPIEIAQALLAPEGDELWVVAVSLSVQVAVYQRAGDHTWQYAHDLQLPADEPYATPMTSPTRGPNRRFVDFGLNTGTVYEREAHPDGTVTTIHAYMPQALGVPSSSGIALTADGLRLLLVGGNGASPDQTYFTDRADVSSDFRQPAVASPNAPSGRNPYLSEDCAKLCADALGYVFYAQQK